MRTILLLLMVLGWGVFVEAQGVKGSGGETPRVETPRRHGERGLDEALPRPRGDGMSDPRRVARVTGRSTRVGIERIIGR